MTNKNSEFNMGSFLKKYGNNVVKFVQNQDVDGSERDSVF